MIRRGNEHLVSRGHDPTKRESFRPPGGGIDFGELRIDAIRREIREELAVELGDVAYLGMLENLFVYDGNPGHEIVLVHEAAFADRNDYARRLEATESDGASFEVMWKDVADFGARGETLYPTGLLELIRSATPTG